MKTDFLRILLVFASGVATLACSKKDDSPVPVPPTPPQTEWSNTTLTVIPDEASGINGSVFVPINVTREGIIGNGSKVSVEIDLEHTYALDVAVQLIAPSGETVGLIKRIVNSSGAGRDNFKAGNKLVFKSTFTTLIPITGITTTDIPGGNYKPTFGTILNPTDVSESPMDAYFLNKNIKGVWKLQFYDCESGDVGSVVAWKITFEDGSLQ